MASNQPEATTPAPSPDAPSTPHAESRTERLGRHGRRARLFYTGAVVFVALVAVLVVLSTKNTLVVALWLVANGLALVFSATTWKRWFSITSS